MTRPADDEGGTDARPRPDIAAAVLAGGGSQRMGQDKAALVVDGGRLLNRAVGALRTAAPGDRPVLVVGPHPMVVDGSPEPVAAPPEGARASAQTAPPAITAELPHGARWISDLRPAAGPLAGLEAALAAAEDAEVVLLTGVDHPWQVPAVLRRLVDRLVEAEPGPSAVVLGTADGPQLLVGAYRPAALATVRGLLDAGERRLRSLRDHLDVEVLPPESWRDLDPVGATAVDVDDPDTLAAATRWHRRAVATAPGAPAGAPTAGSAATAGGMSDPAAQPGRGSRSATSGREAAPGRPARQDRGARAATSDRLATPTRRVLRVHSPTNSRTNSRTHSRRDSIEVERLDDVLVGEEPLEIRAAGPDQEPVTLATTLRTPGHEPELAAGWVLAEGLADPTDIVTTESGDPLLLARPEDTITVRLRRAVDPNTLVHRHVIATASCGVCGRATIEELAARVAPITDDAFGTDPLTWSQLARSPDELRLAQGRFRATGGVHAAGLFDSDGRLVTVREDVGRHNALDAAIGAHALAGLWPPSGLTDLVCVLSGRVGFELVAKAAVAGLPIVAAVGAPSELAVRTAERFGITLVGFLRAGDGNVYTAPQRLDLGDRGPTARR